MTSEIQGFLECVYGLNCQQIKSQHVQFCPRPQRLWVYAIRVSKKLDFKLKSSTAIPSREKELMRSMIDMSNLVCDFGR